MTNKKPLSELRVLLCNDDGIDADGIAILEAFARKTFGEVWLIAPKSEQSAKSRALTVRAPINFEQRLDKKFAVDGTPVDCIVVALNGLMRDQMPDLVLSGVNVGANLAEDVGYSGTIGCAMEAVLQGVPAIAFSQCFLPVKGPLTRESVPWAIAESQLGNVVEFLKVQEPVSDLIYNVNFPPLMHEAGVEIRMSSQGRREKAQSCQFQVDNKGCGFVKINKLRQSKSPAENTDLAIVKRGHVSITPLGLDAVHPAFR